MQIKTKGMFGIPNHKIQLTIYVRLNQLLPAFVVKSNCLWSDVSVFVTMLADDYSLIV